MWKLLCHSVKQYSAKVTWEHCDKENTGLRKEDVIGTLETITQRGASYSYHILLFACVWHNSPTRAKAASYSQFLDHTQLHTTVGRNSLYEGSARRSFFIRALSLAKLPHRTPYVYPMFYVLFKLWSLLGCFVILCFYSSFFDSWRSASDLCLLYTFDVNINRISPVAYTGNHMLSTSPGYTSVSYGSCSSFLFHSQFLLIIQSNSVITSSQSPNKLFRYKRVLLEESCMAKVKEKGQNESLWVCYVNVYAMIQFKLQIKFRNNCCFIIANLYTGVG